LNRPRRLWPLWLLVALAPVVHADDTKSPAKKPAASATTTAKPPAPAADDELLEFLGSVGEDADGDWIDYLSKTDMSKVPRAKEKAPPATEVSRK
jgi:hypothetical protein